MHKFDHYNIEKDLTTDHISVELRMDGEWLATLGMCWVRGDREARASALKELRSELHKGRRLLNGYELVNEVQESA